MGSCKYTNPLLLCCLTAIALIDPLHSAEEAPAPQLAAELLKAYCNAGNFTPFYLHVREQQGTDRRYPSWPNSNSKLFFLHVTKLTPCGVATSMKLAKSFVKYFFCMQQCQTESFRGSVSAGPLPCGYCQRKPKEIMPTRRCRQGLMETEAGIP
jgi:hypothetical protein